MMWLITRKESDMKEKLRRTKKLNLVMLITLVTVLSFSTVNVNVNVNAAALGKVKITKVKNCKKKLWGEKYTAGYKVSWKKVKGAKGYKVYAYGVASKKWRCIKTTKKRSYYLTNPTGKSN